MPKILVVEDDPALLKLLERVLVEKGHEVAVAEDGELALRLVETFRPDLVVTDLLMPVLDGYELLTQLRSRAATKVTPVIVLSELQTKESRLAAFRLGCDDFLPKPFEMEELCLRISKVLRSGRSSSTHLSAQPPGVQMHGCLGELALPSVLTLLETDRQTGVLELRGNELSARLFLDAGRVVHAVDLSDPSKEPFDVVCRSLRLTQGKFSVCGHSSSVPDRLHMSLTQLLLDAFRQIDEEDARACVAASEQVSHSMR